MTRQTSNLPTLNSVNAELIRLADEMETVTGQLIEADKKATRARAEADYAETASFLASDGAMDLRKQLAKDAATKKDWNARQAEAEVRHARAKIADLKERIESVRSVGANLKAEIAIYGSGYGSGA